MTNPTQSETLLPCPFCGSEPFRADGGTCFVGCSASTEECPVSPTVRTFGNADAAKFWNTRLQSIPEPLSDEGLMEREVCWLLEWAGDKHLPVRYYAADEHQPVLDANLATRFCRREDALAVGRAVSLAPKGQWRIPSTKECTAVEHIFIGRAALSIPRLEAGRVTGSLTLDNASVQRLMDYGLLHYTDEGWVVSKDIWNASAPDGPALTELEDKKEKLQKR